MECPNKDKSAHGVKLKLTWSGRCSDCGRQVTHPPLRHRPSGAASRAITTRLYNGAPE